MSRNEICFGYDLQISNILFESFVSNKHDLFRKEYGLRVTLTNKKHQTLHTNYIPRENNINVPASGLYFCFDIKYLKL